MDLSINRKWPLIVTSTFYNGSLGSNFFISCWCHLLAGKDLQLATPRATFFDHTEPLCHCLVPNQGTMQMILVDMPPSQALSSGWIWRPQCLLSSPYLFLLGSLMIQVSEWQQFGLSNSFLPVTWFLFSFWLPVSCLYFLIITTDTRNNRFVTQKSCDEGLKLTGVAFLPPA